MQASRLTQGLAQNGAVEFMQIGQPDFITAVQTLRQHPQSQNMRKSGVDRSQLFRTHRTFRPGQLQPLAGIDCRRGRGQRENPGDVDEYPRAVFLEVDCILVAARDLATEIQRWFSSQRVRGHQVLECRRIAGKAKHQAPQ